MSAYYMPRAFLGYATPGTERPDRSSNRNIDLITTIRYYGNIMAIKSFKDKVTEDINYGRVSKQTLKRLPFELHQRTQIKLARIGAATSLRDLQELRGNRLEVLKGNRKGQYSIRINDQYRICFRWVEHDAFDLEIIDYH